PRPRIEFRARLRAGAPASIPWPQSSAGEEGTGHRDFQVGNRVRFLMPSEFWCDSAFALSVYQRKPPEELHLGERLQGGFLPPTGRIPPDSGGWHRGVFSRSVAGARTERPLLIRNKFTTFGR